jgi:CubicO group peptidase (beta-lactamase class C family)
MDSNVEGRRSLRGEPALTGAALLIGLVGWLGGCASTPPPPPMLPPTVQEQSLPTSTFEALGLDGSAWRAVVDEIERRRLPIDQMALLVDGRRVADLHLNGHGPRSLHDLRSATKSVTSLLVGLALQRGVTPGLDEPIGKLFAEPWARGPAADLTLRDLLTMRTGLDCDDWDPASRGNEERMYRSGDWLRFLFELPRRGERGVTFSYCTAGVVLAGEVVARATGRALPAFAQEALFAPLGIVGARWQAAPLGVTDAGGHLMVTLDAMLSVGELMRQDGLWNGHRVLPDSWVRHSLEPVVRVDSSGRFSAAWMGLAWWLEPVREGRVLSFQARGNGGQWIVVLPEFGAVVAFTGHAYNADAATQLAPLELLQRHLVPMLRARRPP